MAQSKQHTVLNVARLLKFPIHFTIIIPVHPPFISFISHFPQFSFFRPTAVWMLPRNWPYGRWPASGEIDIVEARGRSRGQRSLYRYFIVRIYVSLESLRCKEVLIVVTMVMNDIYTNFV